MRPSGGQDRRLRTLLLMIALLAGPPAAHAHPFVRATDPPQGARLQGPPGEVRLVLNEAVVPGISTASLLASGGRTIAGGPLQLDPDRRGGLLPLPPLGGGTYTVTWKVLSAVDGHVVRGRMRFSVALPQGAGGRIEAEAPERAAPTGPLWMRALLPLRTFGMWAHLASVLVVFGSLLGWATILRPFAPEVPLPLVRLVIRGALVGVASALLVMQTEWLEVSDAPWPETLQVLLFFPAIPVALGTYSSIAAFMRAALLAGTASLATRMPGHDPVALPCIAAFGAGALVSLSVASHTAAAGGWWWAASDLVHLAAGAIWLGGLVCLAWAPALAPTAPLKAVIRRFTPWAAGAAAALWATGIANGLLHLPAVRALWTTAYGATLGAKALLAIAMVALGGGTLLSREGCGRPPRGGNWIRSRWGIRLEVFAGMAALLFAAALTQLPPPATTLATRDSSLPAVAPAIVAGLASAVGVLIGFGLQRALTGRGTGGGKASP